MPNPYPDPFSGLTQGFSSGMGMGLQMRAQGLAEQKLKADQDAKVAQDKAEKEKKNFEQGIQLLDTGAKYRKFGPAYQEKALELIKKGGTLLGMEMPENMPTYQQEFDEVGSDIELAIKGFKQFGDRDVLEKGLRGAYTKAGSILEANDLKALKEDTGAQVKDMVGRQEASMLAQAARIPDLAKQTDSEGNPLLSPEQAKEGTINAYRSGGAKGQELLAKGLEGTTDNDTGLTTVIGKDGKPHAMLYKKSTGEIIKDMGVTKSETESGRDYVIVSTDSGVVSVNKKTNTATPVTMGGDNPVYGKTPSEVKLSHKNYADNLSAVESVRDIYKTGSTGPVTGRTRKYGSKFYSDKDYTQLKNRVGQLRTIVYGMSGKAINESELSWLKEDILPSLLQPSDNFEVTLNEYEAWVKRNSALLEREYPALSSGSGKTKDKPSGKRSLDDFER